MSADEHLSEAQFRAYPRSKEGHNIYLSTSGDDPMPWTQVHDKAELQTLLGRKTGHRYTDAGEWRRTPIHEWHVDRPSGRLKIPAGYQIPEDFNPLR